MTQDLNTFDRLGPCPLLDVGLRIISNSGPTTADPCPLSFDSATSDPCPLSWLHCGENLELGSDQNLSNLASRKRIRREIGKKYSTKTIMWFLLEGQYQRESQA